MKTKLLKLALCAMTLLPLGAWADEEVVSTTTTWTFNSRTTADNVYTANTAWNVTDKLYDRSIKDRNYSIKDITGSALNLLFSDTYEVSASKYALMNNNFTVSNSSTLKTAGEASNDATPAFAFNASVPGTVYVLMQEDAVTHSTSYRQCIYFSTSSTAIFQGVRSEGKKQLEVEEVSYTSTEPGTFYIGSNTPSRIYAIRFVPTTRTISIGSTGYATFGNNDNVGYSIPTGLKAYAATATSSSVVTLTPVSQIRKLNGYVLKGTPSTNYTLTAAKDNGESADKGGEMVRVKTAIANFPASVIESETTYYQYILASDEGTAKFFAPNGTSTLAAGKAYLKTTTQLSASSLSRGFNIVFEDESTAINSVTTKVINDGKYYNLQGVEVAQPTKGLYILNGRKVIIK